MAAHVSLGRAAYAAGHGCLPGISVRVDRSLPRRKRSLRHCGTAGDSHRPDPLRGGRIEDWSFEPMRINPDKCVACGNCTYVCPMGAIYIDPAVKRATVNLQECVECYSCYNGLSQEHLNPTMVRTMRKIFQWMRVRFDPEPDVCPTAAFEPETLA